MNLWNKTEKPASLSARQGIVSNRILALILAIALIGSSFAGTAYAADEAVSSMTITASPSVPSGQKGQLIVEGDAIILTAYAVVGSTQKNVTEDAAWTSTSTSVKVAKGVVTATGPVSTATITARYKDATATYEVTAEYKYDELQLQLNGSVVSDKMDASLGQDLNFTAWGIKNGSRTDETKNAAWTTSNSNVATVDKGVVKLLGAGETTIAAKYKGKTESIEIKVESPYEDLHIRNNNADVESPIELYLGASDTLELTAVADLKSGGTDTITDDAAWTSSNPAVVKIDDKKKGKIVAVGKGTAVVTATRFGVSDSVTVIVKTEYEALKVTPEKPIYMTLYGAKVELSATAANGEKGHEPVTDKAEWKIPAEGQAVAVIDKGSDGKTYVVPKGAGNTQISIAYLGLTKTISVNVSPTIESISIAKESLDAFSEETGTLPAVTGTLLTGETRDVGNYGTWISSDPEVVAIEDGKWKAVAKGTAKLIFAVPGMKDETLRKEVSISVHNKILALIPSQETMSVVIGKEVNLPQVTLIYENGEEEPITDKIAWKSSTPNLLVKPTSMKGLLAATATLTGTYLNKTVKIKVTVEEEFMSFAITPNKISLTLNRSQSIKVVGTTKSGKKISIGNRIEWKAENEEHLSIKGASVKALSESSGKLTATVQGKSLEVPYVVTARLTKLTASDTKIDGVVGKQYNVGITALYENGKTASVASMAAWTTSKAAVATVENGKITANGKGTATIRGTFAGKAVSIRVTVK